MINNEQDKVVVPVVDTDELKVTEYIEPVRKIVVETNKRSEKFLIIRGSPRTHFFKIIYESGKSIPDLDGMYTSSKEALDKLLHYIDISKKSKLAQYKERWGDKPVPELKTKKRKPESAFSSTDITDGS